MHVCENQIDAAIGQVFLKLPHHLRRRVIHIRNCSGIHDEPAHGRRRRVRQACESHPRTCRHSRKREPRQTGRLLAPGSVLAPGSTGVSCQMPPSGLPPVPPYEDDNCGAQYAAATATHREYDALFDAHQHDNARGSQCQPEFAGAFRADIPQAAEVGQVNGHGKYDGSQHASRQVLEGTGSEKGAQAKPRPRPQRA